MAEYYKNVLCVTSKDLTDGVITYSNYNKMVTRKKIDVLKTGGGENNYSLIRWSNLPDRIKSAYKSKYGDPTKRSPYEKFEQMIEDDPAAEDFFATYLFSNGEHIAPDIQSKYILNCKILSAAVKCQQWKTSYIHALGGNFGVMGFIVNAINAMRIKYKHTLPESERRLREALSSYKRDGYASVISGYHNNKKAAKVFGAEQEASLRMLLSHYRNLDDMQICKLYNMLSEKAGWKTITAGTVANKRKQWDLFIYAGNKGETAFNNKKQMLIKRSAPTMPLLYWTADGWDVELLYQKTVINKDGRSITTYHNRLTVVVVLDPCCKYPVGYAIGEQECTELIRQAFRNAVKHTKELFGEMYRPMQIQTDHYGRGALKPFYEAVSAKYYTPAKIKNAKGKVVEPYFKELNRDYCQLMMPNWAGYGVKSDGQPNPDMLDKIKKDEPDESGCRKQIESIIAMERAKKVADYKNNYQLLPEDKKYALSESEYLYRLCEHTDRTIRLQPMGICPKIGGVQYYYDSFDPNFRTYNYLDWTLHYDPADLNRVLVTGNDDKVRFICEEKHMQPMALAEREAGDSEQLHRVFQYNEELKERVLDTMSNDYNTVNSLFDEIGKDETLLSKILITDSRGQHKDRRNAARLHGNIVQSLQAIEVKENKEKINMQRNVTNDYISKRVRVEDYL